MPVLACHFNSSFSKCSLSQTQSGVVREGGGVRKEGASRLGGEGSREKEKQGHPGKQTQELARFFVHSKWHHDLWCLTSMSS